MENIVIQWRTRNAATIEAIRERFGIPRYTTINGWSPVELSPENEDVFNECVRRKFFRVVEGQKWCKKGDQIIFLSRKK